jgi:hypothetical protein
MNIPGRQNARELPSDYTACGLSSYAELHRVTQLMQQRTYTKLIKSLDLKNGYTQIFIYKFL